jgi:hypothetical protein
VPDGGEQRLRCRDRVHDAALRPLAESSRPAASATASRMFQ